MRIAVDGRNLVARRTGIARYFVEICETLATRGHEITFLLPSSPAPDFTPPGNVVLDIAAFPGRYGRLAWSAAALSARVRRIAPDIFWGPAHRLAAGLPATLARVVTVHDLVWLRAPDTMRFGARLADRLLMGHAVANADIVCVNSKATAGDVLRRYPTTAGRVRVVPPAVGLAHAADAVAADELATRFGLDGPYVLFVGTIEPRKNLERLIAAYASLGEEVRGRCRLVICGGAGWKSRDPRAVASGLGVAGRVTVTGHVTDGELAGLYAGASCLAMPSLLEGFGMPIVEAQRFGVPVLTSDRSSMPEVAGEGGLFVDPCDVGSIARGLERLVTDAGLHARLSEGARKNAARFAAEKSALAMEEAFADAKRLRKTATAT